MGVSQKSHFLSLLWHPESSLSPGVKLGFAQGQRLKLGHSEPQVCKHFWFDLKGKFFFYESSEKEVRRKCVTKERKLGFAN